MGRAPGAPGQAEQDPHAAGAALPPGLFEPSFDHLSHALAHEEPFLPVPPGTETEYPRQRLGTLVPQGFTQEEFAVVRRLVEIILGEDLKRSSEKPAEGAPASIYDEVAEWIDLVVASAPGIRKLARSLPAEQRALAVAYFGSGEPVRHLETFECERVCHEGIAWLGEESQRHFAKGFLDVNPAGQVELVRPSATCDRISPLFTRAHGCSISSSGGHPRVLHLACRPARARLQRKHLLQQTPGMRPYA